MLWTLIQTAMRGLQERELEEILEFVRATRRRADERARFKAPGGE